jgi:hypothetical protein
MFTKTNNQPRDLYSLAELPSGVAESDFDYVERGEDDYSPRFFPYRGSWYDTQDGFTVTGDMPSGVEAWQAESYFSAVGIRYVEDYERVVVTYCHW